MENTGTQRSESSVKFPKLVGSTAGSQSQAFYLQTHAQDYYKTNFLHEVCKKESLTLCQVQFFILTSIFDPDLVPTSLVFCRFQIQSVFKTMVKNISCRRMSCVSRDSALNAHFYLLFSCSYGHLKTGRKLWVDDKVSIDLWDTAAALVLENSEVSTSMRHSCPMPHKPQRETEIHLSVTQSKRRDR